MSESKVVSQSAADASSNVVEGRILRQPSSIYIYIYPLEFLPLECEQDHEYDGISLPIRL